MGVPLLQIDAFSAEPFAGNPAAVCLLETPARAVWMQQVAAEMNLSETAFVVPRGEDFDLRWFTPTLEVDLCGHATLASAHALWEMGRLERSSDARFHTRSGLLTATSADPWIVLDFPARPAREAEAPSELLAALGCVPLFVGRGGDDYVVMVGSEAEVRALAPDLRRLATVPVRGTIVTSAASTPDYDFVSRFFAPASGIDEDPVTGSAHCSLGPFWAARLGRSLLVGYQASARGGVVVVEVCGQRVRLRGQATTVFRGELVVK